MSNRIHRRILFGLKLRQLRQHAQLSFAELSEKTGMSVSYLNEIEKGKKFPKEEKTALLAQALGVSVQVLLDDEFDEGLAPAVDLLRSNFLNELPLDLFGIDLAKVVEMIASAPARVGAFIATLLELARNYAVKEEHFYFAALRSYLELHHNYFEDLELEVERFIGQYEIPDTRPLAPVFLKQLLEKRFGYSIREQGLDPFPELAHLRSVFVPQRKELLLNGRLAPMQQSFQYGKELAFQYLQIQERALTSSLLKGRTFEEVLNHSKAIYFSVALLFPLKAITRDMEAFFRLPKWDGAAFLQVMSGYDASPEMYFHRLTNILPRYFGMRKLFFLRFVQDTSTDTYSLDRELYLNQRHHPHGNRLDEHYCRRWLSLSLLRELQDLQQSQAFSSMLVKAQVSHYLNTEDAYLCLTIARAAYPGPSQNVSVTIGLQVNEELREKVNFLNDPAIIHRQVHTTCERCPLMDCPERSAPPTIIEKRIHLNRIEEKIKALTQ